MHCSVRPATAGFVRRSRSRRRPCCLIRVVSGGRDGFVADGAVRCDPVRRRSSTTRSDWSTPPWAGSARSSLSSWPVWEPPKQAARPADNAALLDAIPRLNIDLAWVPEEIQRRLYNAFGLEVRYSRPGEELTLRVTIPGHLLGTKNRAPAPKCWHPIMTPRMDNHGKTVVSIPIFWVPPAEDPVHGDEPGHWWAVSW